MRIIVEAEADIHSENWHVKVFCVRQTVAVCFILMMAATHLSTTRHTQHNHRNDEILLTFAKEWRRQQKKKAKINF